MTGRLCALLLVLICVTPACAAETRDYTYFLNELVNLDGLPLIQEGVKCALASSCNREWQYNPNVDHFLSAAHSIEADSSKWVRYDQARREGVMAELEGPGCIVRLWSANPEGVIRFYLDGDTEPTYEFDFDALMSGDIEPFNRPLVWQRQVVLGAPRPEGRPSPDFMNWGVPYIHREGNAASTCYVPIPFAKSCKVTSTTLRADGYAHAPPRRLYYQVGYKLYPKDWQVETFSLPLKPEYKAKLEEVARLWNACGEDPQPAGDVRTQNATIEVKPGGTAKLFDLNGPATIRQFHAKVISKDPLATRNVVLRAFWDGETEPSVLTPIGDFFGRAVGREAYRSLPVGMTDEMDYCYWRMPFQKHGTLAVENQGTEAVTIEYRIVYTTGPVPENVAYFHAKWRREAPGRNFDYALLDCDGGAGVFVGDVLAIDNRLGKWWGEGNEKFYVDGEAEPSSWGTGTEDYYGDGWGIRWFVNALHGCPQNEGRRQLMYRWHISDSVPFSKSFRMTLDNYSALHEDMQNGYTSVAYWYQVPGGRDFFPTELPRADERRPSPKVIMPYAVEAERIVAAGSKATIIDEPDTRDLYSWGRAVRSTGPTLNLTLPVERDDVYALALFEKPNVPLGQDACTLLYNGKPVGRAVHLTKGEHTVTVKLAPERSDVITLDYLTMVPFRNFITEWLVLGPFDNEGDKGFDRVYPPEQKLDFDAEYDVKGGTAKWERLGAKTGGLLNFDVHFYPNDWVVAYAYVEVVSPDARDTELLIGSDDGVKVWLNGELVHENHVHRACVADQDRAKISLKKGLNTLLFKVDDGITDWGLAARIVDPDDTLEYRLPPKFEYRFPAE